jgi:hypothetical protein
MTTYDNPCRAFRPGASTVMEPCVPFKTILEIGRGELDEMAQAADIAQSKIDGQDDGDAFEDKVKLVEGFMRQVWRIAVQTSRNTDELESIASIWQSFISFCDDVVRISEAYKDAFLHGETSELYDLALDYRIAAQERYNDVLEEIRCLKIETPAGLFQ